MIDVYPTILKTAGIAPEAKPGTSFVDLANAEDDLERLIFSEYHAVGSPTGAFMIRKGYWKLIYYVSIQPQLFNLAEDPEELRDLVVDPKHEGIRKQLEAELRLICDPEEVDSLAKADQTAIVNANGGIEGVVAKSGFGATPPPVVDAEFANGK